MGSLVGQKMLDAKPVLFPPFVEQGFAAGEWLVQLPALPFGGMS